MILIIMLPPSPDNLAVVARNGDLLLRPKPKTDYGIIGKLEERWLPETESCWPNNKNNYYDRNRLQLRPLMKKPQQNKAE